MELDPVRRVSRALFGHRYRLELLAALAEAGEQGVCVSDLADANGVKASVFYPPLNELERIGLVSRRRDGAGRRVYWATTGHGAWSELRNFVHEVRAAVGEPLPARGG